MVVEGSYSFPAKREVVWELLLDPEVIAKTMPGATAMVRVAHEQYRGKLRLGVGSFTAAEFDLSVVLADVTAPERYTMLIDGQGKLGFTRGSAAVRLAADGAGTQLHITADLQVGGTVAGLGQRLLDAVGRVLLKQGFEGLAQEVNRRLLGGQEPKPRSSVNGAPPIDPVPPD